MELNRIILKESERNWSMLLYITLAIPLCFILVGIPIVIALVMFRVICIIIASEKAPSGEIFRYPLSIPFFH